MKSRTLRVTMTRLWIDAVAAISKSAAFDLGKPSLEQFCPFRIAAHQLDGAPMDFPDGNDADEKTGFVQVAPPAHELGIRPGLFYLRQHVGIEQKGPQSQYSGKLKSIGGGAGRLSRGPITSSKSKSQPGIGMEIASFSDFGRLDFEASAFGTSTCCSEAAAPPSNGLSAFARCQAAMIHLRCRL
jgi:hypothetical protein